MWLSEGCRYPFILCGAVQNIPGNLWGKALSLYTKVQDVLTPDVKFNARLIYHMGGRRSESANPGAVIVTTCRLYNKY